MSSSNTYKMIIKDTSLIEFEKQANYDWFNDIKIDKRKKTFSIGDYQFDESHLELESDEICRIIESDNGLHINVKTYIGKYGIFRLFRKSCFELYVSTAAAMDANKLLLCDDSLIDETSINPKYFKKFNQIYRDRESLKSARLVCYRYGKTPKEAKLLTGKGSWSKICRQDSLALRHIFNQNADFDILSCDNLNIFLDLIDKGFIPKDSISFLSPKLSDDSVKCLLINIKNKKLDDLVQDESSYVNLISEAFFVIRDCKELLNSLGEEFNVNWSLRRIKREHDLASSKQTYKTMGMNPNDKISIPKCFEERVKSVSEKSGCEIKILKTAKDYMEEGLLMHHCIASYAKKAVRGEYVAVHMKLNGTQVTAGYTSTPDGLIKLEQVKSFYNETDFPNEILETAKLMNYSPKYKTLKQSASEVSKNVNGLKSNLSDNLALNLFIITSVCIFLFMVFTIARGVN